MIVEPDGAARGRAALMAVPRPAVPFDLLDRPPGYHDLHPDVPLNFQLNRWLAAVARPGPRIVLVGLRRAARR